jgi:hypothetical protein
VFCCSSRIMACSSCCRSRLRANTDTMNHSQLTIAGDAGFCEGGVASAAPLTSVPPAPCIAANRAGLTAAANQLLPTSCWPCQQQAHLSAVCALSQQEYMHPGISQQPWSRPHRSWRLQECGCKRWPALALLHLCLVPWVRGPALVLPCGPSTAWGHAWGGLLLLLLHAAR